MSERNNKNEGERQGKSELQKGIIKRKERGIRSLALFLKERKSNLLFGALFVKSERANRSLSLFLKERPKKIALSLFLKRPNIYKNVKK